MRGRDSDAVHGRRRRLPDRLSEIEDIQKAAPLGQRYHNIIRRSIMTRLSSVRPRMPMADMAESMMALKMAGI